MSSVNFVILVCQSSSKVVLDVGVHDRSEVVETAVPEQVNDKHLNTHIYTDMLVVPPSSSSSYRQNTSFMSCAALIFLPMTGKPAVHIYQCCHLKDRRGYPGRLARTVRKKKEQHSAQPSHQRHG